MRMVKDDYPEIDDVHCDDDRFSEAMPFVLERAFEKSRDIHPSFRRSDREKDATGIYYFLRSEPAFVLVFETRNQEMFLPHYPSVSPNGEKSGKLDRTIEEEERLLS